MIRRFHRFSAATALCALLGASPVSAACVNKYTHRRDGSRLVFTLLTGKLTFPEARDLAKKIQEKKSPALEWVTEKGKPIASQNGDLKVIRPMPVGCDGKKSGVLMNVGFLSMSPPSREVNIKLDADRIVEFDLAEN